MCLNPQPFITSLWWKDSKPFLVFKIHMQLSHEVIFLSCTTEKHTFLPVKIETIGWLLSTSSDFLRTPGLQSWGILRRHFLAHVDGGQGSALRFSLSMNLSYQFLRKLRRGESQETISACPPVLLFLYKSWKLTENILEKETEHSERDAEQ